MIHMNKKTASAHFLAERVRRAGWADRGSWLLGVIVPLPAPLAIVVFLASICLVVRTFFGASSSSPCPSLPPSPDPMPSFSLSTAPEGDFFVPLRVCLGSPAEGVRRPRALRSEVVTSSEAASSASPVASSSDSSFTTGVVRFVRLLTRDPTGLATGWDFFAVGDSAKALVRRPVDGMRVGRAIDGVTITTSGVTRLGFDCTFLPTRAGLAGPTSTGDFFRLEPAPSCDWADANRTSEHTRGISDVGCRGIPSMACLLDERVLVREEDGIGSADRVREERRVLVVDVQQWE
ncbi:uncharacterized protein EI90DRAFT_639405 [Cantharellus anzutake]|uniref:uncharacterized protein n=1 Tax=Cantharellus anzutake TaxID=1750568 RepID=UPI0019082D63|nr:uncharacterized protein EI90DRAFT_639405 [Cantharellus anzutake]KAF8333193.1 hypothetical protein EI90DRAFT_639405 [Cantharellus anzutake]